MTDKTIELIAAVSENGVIGQGMEIPWRVKGEQKLFKEITLGGTLVMGRKTYESIGRPLPGRQTIILTQAGFAAEGTTPAASLDEAIIQASTNRIYIAGGGEIYRLALPLATGLHLTTIHTRVEGDVQFPPYQEDDFKLIKEKQYHSNIDYTYRHYLRKRPK